MKNNIVISFSAIIENIARLDPFLDVFRGKEVLPFAHAVTSFLHVM